jgi:hypothetical protein
VRLVKLKMLLRKPKVMSSKSLNQLRTKRVKMMQLLTIDLLSVSQLKFDIT